MAFNSAPGRAEYTAIAAQTIFPFTFKIYLDGDIKVYLTPTGQAGDDVADILTITTDYTVSIDGDNGGSITLVSGATSGDSVTLIRDLDINRLIEYQNNGDLLADTLNQDQNYQTYLIADKDAENETHLRLPTSVQNVSVELPSPLANTYLIWNSTATALENDTTIPTNVQLAVDSASDSASSASDSATSATNAANSAIEVKDKIDTAETIADMLLLDPLINPNVNVLGYSSINDGGGGIFNYVSAQSAVNNGGTIIDGWVRQYSGAVNAKWFGAVPSSDGTTEIQSCLDNIVGDIEITDDFNISSKVTIRSNQNIKLTSTLTWVGTTGGTVFGTPTASVLSNSSFICDGGVIDMVDAGFGFFISSTQLSEFDLEFSGNSTTATAVKIQGNGSSVSGSTFGTTNVASNRFHRIVHTNQCGILLHCIGENNATLGGIITLNTFGFIRAAFAAIGGILIEGWTDTNLFSDAINIRLNANDAYGLQLTDDAEIYENKFNLISVGAYGSFTGRIGASIGANTRHIKIDKLFIDGDLSSEGGNLVANASAQSYEVSLHYVDIEGVKMQSFTKNFFNRATSYNSEDDKVLLADDTATSFTLRRDYGIITINSTSGNAVGVVWVKVLGAGAATKKLAGDTTFFEVTTGALTGTTGTDARFTVSAHTDGKVYLENRLGSGIYVTWTTLGAFS